MEKTNLSNPENRPALQDDRLPEHFDVIIIGAGAAGLMCAIEAGRRNRRVLLLDRAKKPAEKIRISGGGRCNFTNIHTAPENYISRNPRFCVSALRRYRPQDFIDLVDRYQIKWHEKTLGQLFCDNSAKDIIDMLLRECELAGVTLVTSCEIGKIAREDDHFDIETNIDFYSAETLVIASGGPSIPKMGASSFGYKIARQFGLKVIDPRAGLVPLTFSGPLKEKLALLAGVSVDAEVRFDKTTFREALLFTHRGLSGPAILQISSYWREGEPVHINMLPGKDMFELLKQSKETSPKQELLTVLADHLPRRLAQFICEETGVEGRLADLSHKKLSAVAAMINDWSVLPNGTEGYRTAEVTVGGVDTDELSSKTFDAKKVPGLYFIGEVVDVTGHLGGFNFQWAWASGHACGNAV